jgi:ABC-type hemin transport system substrate-binding protein
MGPNSKAAVLKVLGALTQEARALDTRVAGVEATQREILRVLTANTDAVRENTAMVGETVASHTKANALLTQLRADLTKLEREVHGAPAE